MSLDRFDRLGGHTLPTADGKNLGGCEDVPELRLEALGLRACASVHRMASPGTATGTILS